jgi:hypothetical protein
LCSLHKLCAHKSHDQYATSHSYSILADAFGWLAGAFEWLNVVKNLGPEWNCGGAVSIIAPVVLVVGIVILGYIIQKDVLMKLAISFQGLVHGKTKVKIALNKAKAAGLTKLVLLVCQASFLACYQVGASTFGIEKSCSPLDRKMVLVGRYLSGAFILASALAGFMLFTGAERITKRFLLYGWLLGTLHLVKMTFGWWSDGRIRKFRVVQRAAFFDNDDEDDDNQQELVIKLLGQSRGLIWLPIPGVGFVLAKVAEFFNNPPIFVFAERVDDFKIVRAVWKRQILWAVNFIKLAAMIMLVVTNQAVWLIVMLVATVMFFALGFILD